MVACSRCGREQWWSSRATADAERRRHLRFLAQRKETGKHHFLRSKLPHHPLSPRTRRKAAEMGAKLKKFKKPSSHSAASAGKKANGSAAVAGKSQKKKQRGPKAYISDASDHLVQKQKNLQDGSGSEESDGEEDLRAAMEAEDMAGAGVDSESELGEGEDEEVVQSKPVTDKGKGKAVDSGAQNFLLTLDKKAISRSVGEGLEDMSAVSSS